MNHWRSTGYCKCKSTITRTKLGRRRKASLTKIDEATGADVTIAFDLVHVRTRFFEFKILHNKVLY